MKTFPAVFLSLLLAVSACGQEKSAPAPDAASAAEQKAIIDRLNKVVIPRVEFRYATLGDGLAFLQRKYTDAVANAPDSGPDASRTKLNIVYKPGPNPSTQEPRLTLSLSNIPLGDALHYIALIAGLKVTIGPQGVVFEPFHAGEKPKGDPFAPGEEGGDNYAATDRLNTTILPRIEVRNESMQDVLGLLGSMAQAVAATNRDPRNGWINIVLKLPPEPPPGIRITLSLKNIPLGEALRDVAALAGLKVVVNHNAVLLEPASDQ